MLSEPAFVTRPEQPYAAIRLTLDAATIPERAPPLIEEIIGWVASTDSRPDRCSSTTPRWRAAAWTMKVGAPTTTRLEGDGRVATESLPAGRYATVTYTGPYDQLRAAHELLHEWLAKQGLPPQGMGQGRSTLLEIYHTDPSEEPDPSKWVTEIAFRLGD
jgi:effector-binding domain-containing protein